MARYIARFVKDVLGENGHETEICQRLIEVEAPSGGLAAEFAKTKDAGPNRWPAVVQPLLAALQGAKRHQRCGIGTIIPPTLPPAIGGLVCKI